MSVFKDIVNCSHVLLSDFIFCPILRASHEMQCPILSNLKIASKSGRKCKCMLCKSIVKVKLFFNSLNNSRRDIFQLFISD